MSPCVQDPPACAATGATLTRSPIYPGAALRACTLAEAAPTLPSIAKLLVQTPQLVSFANALKQSQLTAIPGKQVTSESALTHLLALQLLGRGSGCRWQGLHARGRRQGLHAWGGRHTLACAWRCSGSF